jgi:hypothetical protein
VDLNHEKMEVPLIDREYGEEILSNGWNPAVELVTQDPTPVVRDDQNAMPVDLTNEIVELFLRKMYVMQR